MSNFALVFDVCVALGAGRILHSCSEADPEKTWGIVDCGSALGYFDTRSEAWHGVNGVPHRFTREEATLRALRISGSSHGDGICEALEIPSKPTRATVGPMARAGSAPGLFFCCVDWTAGPGIAIETGDGSAFSAAVAFVELVGKPGAYSALAPEAQ